MSICCRDGCRNTTPVKGEEYYKQHCVPRWIQNNMKDHDPSMGRGGHLINYFTSKTVQSPLVRGKWCVTCEKEFSRHDKNGETLFSRPLDWKNPGIMKGAGKLKTSIKYQQFNNGKPFDLETKEGIITGKCSLLLIDEHIEPFNMELSYRQSMDNQLKAKGFVLSVLERLQYHPDADRFPFFKDFRDAGLKLGVEQNFDVIVSKYFNNDPIWEEIKFSMDDPSCAPANSLRDGWDDNQIRIPELGESVKIEWNACGFRFLVFPRLVDQDHMFFRHKSWYLGRSLEFKMAMQEFDSSTMAKNIIDQHEKEQEEKSDDQKPK